MHTCVCVLGQCAYTILFLYVKSEDVADVSLLKYRVLQIRDTQFIRYSVMFDVVYRKR